jgi:hypothetical protein
MYKGMKSPTADMNKLRKWLEGELNLASPIIDVKKKVMKVNLMDKYRVERHG